MPKFKDTSSKSKKSKIRVLMRKQNKPKYAMLDEQGHELFDVEYIYGKKFDIKDQEIKYLVKWQGYKKSDSTWEPEAHLISVYTTVKEYDRAQSRQIFFSKILKKPIENAIYLTADFNENEMPASPLFSPQSKAQKDIKEDSKNKNKEILGDSNENSQSQNNTTNKLLTSNSDIKKEGALKEKKNEEREKKSKKKSTKIEGNFKTNLPKNIVKHKLGKFNSDESLSKVFYKVEWEPDENGNKPKSQYFSLEDLKLNCPLLLIEYFEKNAVLIDNNQNKSDL